MLIASSSQMPARHGQAQRQPDGGDRGQHERARSLRLVSGSPRAGSRPRGPNSSASRAPRRRRQSVRHEFASSGFDLCTTGDSTTRPAGPRRSRVGDLGLGFGRVSSGSVDFLGGPRAAGPVRRPAAATSSRRSRAALRRGLVRRGRVDHPPGRRPVGALPDRRRRGGRRDRRRGPARAVEGVASSARCPCCWTSRRPPRSSRARRVTLPGRPRRRGPGLPARAPAGDVPDPQGRGPPARTTASEWPT